MTIKIATYGTLKAVGNRWQLSNIPPHVAIRLKSIFARIPKEQTKVFDLPLTDDMSADLEWFMDRYPMDMAPKDRKILVKRRKAFVEKRLAAERILLPDWQAPPVQGFRDGFGLRHTQAQALELLRGKRALLLGDDVGLGKTWVAMAAGMDTGPMAVVVQAHLATQWAMEFIVPYTNLTVHIIDGTTPYDLPKADVYIFKYSNISGWVDIAAEGIFKTVVYDEIQELRTGTTSSKGRAAMVFSQNADIRLGLSATPVFNYGSEIWNIMSYLDPDTLGPWDEFCREWCVMGAGGKWLVSEPDALGTYLRESRVFLRRIREGRPINRISIQVDYDEDVARESQSLAEKLAMQVMGGTFETAGQAARELDAFARQVTGVAKAKSIAAYARILLQAGTPIIIGLWHREVYDIISKELADFNPMLYTGSETAKQKDRVKKAFMNGDTDCMLISNRSGAGLDGLQKRCATVIVGELDWSPQIYEQLFGRVDRPGQMMDEITAIFLHTNFGSDPTIISVNAVKRNQARGITDPGVGVQPVKTDVSHIKMLAKKFLDDQKRRSSS